MRKAMMVIETTVVNEKGGRDLPMIKELLKMAGWKCSSKAIEGKSKKEMDRFLEMLLGSDERFIHISAHGDKNGRLVIGGSSGRSVSSKDILDYCKKRKLRNPLKQHFITISACGEISGRLALNLHEAAGATAVIAPLANVDFDESAVFMVLFYFALAKYRKRRRTSHRIAQYIDSFQKSKQAYLTIGGTGAFRLDYWWQDEHMSVH